MRVRVILLLIVAAGIGFGTLQFTRGWLDSQRAALERLASRPAEEVVSTQVLVAARDIPAGVFVAANDLRWQPWPDNDMADSYVRNGDRPLEDFVGAVSRGRVAAGEPISDAKLVKPGEQGFLAAVLTPGTRAVTVPVNEIAGVAGLIFPGDRVDVVLTHAVPDETSPERRIHQASETLFKDVRVLAMDQIVDSVDGEPIVAKTATLEVTARQVEAIFVARQLGSLSLSLRSLAADMPTLDDVSGPTQEGLGKNDPAQVSVFPGGRPQQPDGQTYTLDSDVSLLLAGPGREPEPEPQIILPVLEDYLETPEEPMSVVVIRGTRG